MKVKIEGLEYEGTPEELASFKKLLEEQSKNNGYDILDEQDTPPIKIVQPWDIATQPWVIPTPKPWDISTQPWWSYTDSTKFESYNLH